MFNFWMFPNWIFRKPLVHFVYKYLKFVVSCLWKQSQHLVNWHFFPYWNKSVKYMFDFFKFNRNEDSMKTKNIFHFACHTCTLYKVYINLLIWFKFCFLWNLQISNQFLVPCDKTLTFQQIWNFNLERMSAKLKFFL